MKVVNRAEKELIQNTSKHTLKKHVEGLLRERGVHIRDIAQIVYDAQVKYNPFLTVDECEKGIHSILEKREVQNVVMTASFLDKAAENGLIDDPYLSALLKIDDSLYGVDEVLPMGIVNLYGTIGYTNFGYFDKVKPGIIGELDNEDGSTVNTFMDDIVCGIAASCCSRMAHQERDFNIDSKQ